MQKEGLVVATIVLNGSYLAFLPVLSFPGCLHVEEDKDLIAEIQEELADTLEEFLHKNTSKEHDKLDNIIRSTIRRFLRSELSKEPQIEVNIRKI